MCSSDIINAFEVFCALLLMNVIGVCDNYAPQDKQNSQITLYELPS
jgi:hypothetical protein